MKKMKTLQLEKMRYILQDVHFHGNKIHSFYYQIGFPKKGNPRIGRSPLQPTNPTIPSRRPKISTCEDASSRLGDSSGSLGSWMVGRLTTRDFERVDFKREETKKTQENWKRCGLSILVDETF